MPWWTGMSSRPVPADVNDLARVVLNCTAKKETAAELHSSVQSAHEEIQSLFMRIRALEEKQEMDRANHAARLRSLEGR